MSNRESLVARLADRVEELMSYHGTDRKILTDALRAELPVEGGGCGP